MYDFHSHILPNMDDGSRSVAESLAMLRESARQGVTHLAATPHFYADRTNPAEFLEKRRLSWSQLASKLDDTMPHVRLGAEVHYYEGICRLDNITDLCIEETGLLLLEMPFSPWSTRMIDALIALNGKQDIRVLLAHFERDRAYQPRGLWNELCQSGILIQANAEFFLHLRTRRAAIQMLEKGEIHFLGSDCHNMENEKPNLGNAAHSIARKLGVDALRALELRGKEVFR